MLRPGRIVGMTVVYLVQHGEKQSRPGDPGLTAKGRQQAMRTGRWLRERGVQTLCTSPLRRAGETAACIAAVTGLTAHVDARLRERLNWDGSMPLEAFLALWARTSQDRDFAPGDEESSRQAGARLQAFLASLPSTPGPVAAVTHGGITTDLLCNLLGDDGLPPHLLEAGIPPCAVTAIDDLNVVMIASTAHLSLPPP
jgi:broad specificity phosphatase PhoE